MNSKVPRFLRKYWKWKYATLLVVLSFAFLVVPLFNLNSSSLPAVRWAEIATLLCCILATARSRQIMVVATILAVCGETCGFFWPEGRQLCHVLFFVCVSVVVLADVMRPDQVNADKMLGAVCGYLLIATAFAIAYSFLEALNPQSFRTHSSGFQEILYYSLVTISTLGYGDIVPNTAQVRAVASVEAVVGQFYIAIIVARLVSLHQVDLQRYQRPTRAHHPSSEPENDS